VPPSGVCRRIRPGTRPVATRCSSGRTYGAPSASAAARIALPILPAGHAGLSGALRTVEPLPRWEVTAALPDARCAIRFPRERWGKYRRGPKSVDAVAKTFFAMGRAPHTAIRRKRKRFQWLGRRHGWAKESPVANEGRSLFTSGRAALYGKHPHPGATRRPTPQGEGEGARLPRRSSGRNVTEWIPGSRSASLRLP
jgi:hypothetical protein